MFLGNDEFPRAVGGESMLAENYTPPPQNAKLSREEKEEVRQAWPLILIAGIALAFIYKSPTWWPMIQEITL